MAFRMPYNREARLEALKLIKQMHDVNSESAFIVKEINIRKDI